MPITARHTDGRRIDSTNDEQWIEVHRAGYEGLFCPECRSAMHARAGSPRRIRCFAHNPGSSESCSLREGESEDHRRIKVLIAQAVRELPGWTAEIECPGDGWRADVLAVSPSGDRRIAFEPQISQIHESAARERTERHAASGVETIWLDARMRPNLESLPRVRLHCNDRDLRVSISGFTPQGWSPTVEPWWNKHYYVTPGQFAQRVCLAVISYDDGHWATDADRAEMARLVQATHAARKEREAEQRAMREQVLARRQKERAELAEKQRRLAEQWESDRPRRQAEVERARHLQEEQAARWRAEDEARARVERQEYEATAAWRVRPEMSDEEVLALAQRLLEAEVPFPGWLAIGARLNLELSRRGLLHD